MKKLLIILTLTLSFLVSNSLASDADVMEVHKIFKVEKDYKRGMKELLKLGKKGEPLAMVHLGMVYTEGLWIKRDFKKALYWAQKAMEKNQKYAPGALMAIYMDEYGMSTKSFKIVKELADKGYPEAQYNIAVFYLNGINPENRVSEKKYFQYTLKAAEQGMVQAMFRISKEYELGNYIGKSSLESKTWKRRAERALEEQKNR